MDEIFQVSHAHRPHVRHIRLVVDKPFRELRPTALVNEVSPEFVIPLLRVYNEQHLLGTGDGYIEFGEEMRKVVKFRVVIKFFVIENLWEQVHCLVTSEAIKYHGFKLKSLGGYGCIKAFVRHLVGNAQRPFPFLGI